MKMVTEDYVSFETAKLLKEKGFDAECNYEYGVPVVNQGYVLQMFFKPIKNSELINDAYAAPTLQMAMKWLRKKHNLYVTSVPNGIGEQIFYPQIYKNYDVSGWNVLSSSSLNVVQDTCEFSSPEEACEAGIKYCLENLI